MIPILSSLPWPSGALGIALLAAAAIADGETISLQKQTPDVGIVVSDASKAMEFYGEVLGLPAQPAFSLPNGGQMLRYLAGTMTLKLRVLPKSPPKGVSGVLKANGFRLLTLLVPDADAVVRRAAAHGLPETNVQTAPSGLKIALLRDFDGNDIELVGVPAGTVIDRAQLGFTVTDVEKTRNFYTLLGLKELEPKPMPAMGGRTKYSFQAGQSVIKFWAGSKESPTPTGPIDDVCGFRYFTFLVNDLEATEKFLEKQGVRLVSGPNDFAGVARTLFVADPDNNYIEFVQLKAAANTAH